MRNGRNARVLVLLLLLGALAGGLAGEFLVRYPYFTWMSFGGANGYRELFAFSLHPAFDFRILSFGLDFALRVNAGSIIGMILGVILFVKI